MFSNIWWVAKTVTVLCQWCGVGLFSDLFLLPLAHQKDRCFQPVFEAGFPHSQCLDVHVLTFSKMPSTMVCGGRILCPHLTIFFVWLSTSIIELFTLFLSLNLKVGNMLSWEVPIMSTWISSIKQVIFLWCHLVHKFYLNPYKTKGILFLRQKAELRLFTSKLLVSLMNHQV